MVGQAFEFNGGGNHLRVPGSPALDVGKGQAFWWKDGSRSPTQRPQSPIVEWTDGRRGFFGVILQANVEFPGELIADVQGSDGAPRYIRTAPGAPPLEHSSM
jgi:hypothetical protein